MYTLGHDVYGGVRFDCIHEFEDIWVPGCPKFPERVLSKRPEAAARGLAEVIFKDRDRGAAVLFVVRGRPGGEEKAHPFCGIVEAVEALTGGDFVVKREGESEA